MRVLFALQGLHKYNRGAEIVFIAVAREMAKAGDRVTLIGSGRADPAAPYRFLRAPSAPREWFEAFPSLPVFRNEYTYEELTFVPGLLWRYRPADYDVTVTCSYPFTNWVLRRPRLFGARPPHVFMTGNGDWPAHAGNSEYRFFGCEGLICTNPEYFERNKNRWRCRLIPNGVYTDQFHPGPARRQEFGLPADCPIVLMVSALIENKRVGAGIAAVSRVPGAHLVVAGDGPLRQTIDEQARRLLPGRFTRFAELPPDRMPALYRSADVFLHLAINESFGNVFIEAIATGLPVVARNSERVRWIVGEDEFLADSDDDDATARQIVRALAAPPAGREARVRRAAAFSWSRIGAAYREFLHEVAAAPAKSDE